MAIRSFRFDAFSAGSGAPHRPHQRPRSRARWVALVSWTAFVCSSAFVLLACKQHTGTAPSRSSAGATASAPAKPTFERVSAELGPYLASIPRMGRQSIAYEPPDALARALAREAFLHLLAGDPEASSARFQWLGFRLIELHASDARYFVARETAAQVSRGWGAYVINPHPARPYVIEAPHPQNDRYTDSQALSLFQQLGARALLLSTSYRCAARTKSRCGGRTRACGDKRRSRAYPVSDPAHTDESVFHAAHEALLASSRQLIAVQIHGFDRRPDRHVHLLVSDGTRRPSARRSLSNRLARKIQRKLGDRHAALSCNDYAEAPLPALCGTQNVQGRHANGSTEPCTRPARRASKRFLHIEQSVDARLPGGWVEPSVLAEALAEIVPMDTPEGTVASSMTR